MTSYRRDRKSGRSHDADAKVPAGAQEPATENARHDDGGRSHDVADGSGQTKLTATLRRRMEAPTRPRPAIIMAQVVGSGTAPPGVSAPKVMLS